MSYYLMHRGWMDKRIFEREPYNRRNAWEWIIENAAFVDGDGLLRGQLRRSLRSMARAWGWPEPKVRRFLSAARDAEMIVCVTDAGMTLVSVCNYERYQCQHSVGDAAPDAKRRATDAESKEGKKKEDTSPNGEVKTAPARGGRLPADFVMSPEWVEDGAAARARNRLPEINLWLEAEKFCTYWWPKTGAAGTKLDWHKTWTNWCLNAKGVLTNGHGKPRSSEDRMRAGLQAIVDADREEDLLSRGGFDPGYDP